MTRRKRGPWMNSATDPVLEFLDEREIAAPIGVLDNELGPSYRTIKTALEEREYVTRDEEYTSHLRITDRGKQHLQGDRDASDD